MSIYAISIGICLTLWARTLARIFAGLFFKNLCLDKKINYFTRYNAFLALLITACCDSTVSTIVFESCSMSDHAAVFINLIMKQKSCSEINHSNNIELVIYFAD